MDSIDGPEKRRIEEEQRTLVPPNFLENWTIIHESDKEESITGEVPENRSRSREQDEIGSSAASGAADTGVPVETERESKPHIVLVRDTAVGKEDHKVLDLNEKNKNDTQQIRENSTPIEDTFNLDIVTEMKASNESLRTYDLINDQTEAEDDEILGMNIKVTAYNNAIEVNRIVSSVSVIAEKENVGETVNSEETALVPEIASTAKLCGFEKDANKEVLENNVKLKVTTDAEEAGKDKFQSSETGNVVSVAVMDDFDIETKDESMTEVDVNTEINKEEEKVLELNISVEEGKTKQVIAEEESKIDTFVGQEKSHEVVDLKEKLIELEEYPGSRQQDEIHATDLLATSEHEPVMKLDLNSLRTANVNDVSTYIDKEDGAALEKSLFTTTAEESQVPFVPNGIEEAIEFIDSETLEWQKGLPSNGENPMETAVPDLQSDSSLAVDSGRHVNDQDIPAQEKESVESAPVVPSRPSQPLNTSAPHLAGSSNDNIFGSSTEATKSSGRSRIRKPEWMRRSLVRSGSVRRLFSRMRSKRFDHNQHPVTPEPEPRPPPRPFRQIVVEFLLLLFES